MLAHLVGPLREQNGEIYSAATERLQAAIVFRVAAQMVRSEPDLLAELKIVDSTHTITCPGNGSFYRAISAEAGSKHGLNPTVAIYDELAQAKNRELYDALNTSMGARAEPLFLTISTQSNDPNHILSEIIDDGLSDGDPTTVCHLYAVPEDTADIFTEKAWRLANPALGDFRSLDDVRALAAAAERMPSQETTFRNLYLNQRVTKHTPLISRNVWIANGGAPDDDAFTDALVYGGLDLSETTDLTALVLTARKNGFVHVRPYFWMAEGLVPDRAKHDRVPYDVWVRQGLLRTTPGKSIDYGWLAQDIAEICSGLNIAGICFDRYRMALLKMHFDANEVTLPLVDFGQGYKSMSPAVDALEVELLHERMRHGLHPVLTMCANNAVIIRDKAGNRMLDKAKSTGRIDGMVALAMAVGAETMAEPLETGSLDEYLAHLASAA